MTQQPVSIGINTRSRDEAEVRRQDGFAVIKAVTNVTSAGNTTLWTVTSSRFLRIQHFSVCNIAGGAATVTVYVVPDGGAAGNTNKVYDAYSVAANTSESLSALIGGTFLPGDQIIATSGDATGVNLWMSGVESDSGVPRL